MAKKLWVEANADGKWNYESKRGMSKDKKNSFDTENSVIKTTNVKELLWFYGTIEDLMYKNKLCLVKFNAHFFLWSIKIILHYWNL